MNDAPASDARESAPQSGSAIRIFGIGTAGLNVLEDLSAAGIEPGSLVALHSSGSALAACQAAEKVHFTQYARGRGGQAQAEPEADAMDQEQISRLKSLCAGADVIFIIAGLGGAVGTSLSVTLARAARDVGVYVLAFVVFPFECEGSERLKRAETGFQKLKGACDLVVCWPNQNALTLIDPTTSLLETFKSSNRLLTRSIMASWRGLKSETVLGVPFLDLCGSVRRASHSCLLACADAAGQNRGMEVLERLFGHPLLSPDVVEQVRTVGVSVLSGPSLAMAELNALMKHFHRRFPDASVTMGASINRELGDTLLVGLLLVPGANSPDQIESDEPLAVGVSRAEDLPGQLLNAERAGARPPSRFLPPPPDLSAEKMASLLKEQARGAGRTRKNASKLRQSQLPLEIISKGRFDKSEPTIHKGEDLDVPTYIRRGVPLN